jgi:hypothetical protein
MIVSDAAEIAGTRVTKDGYLAAVCRVARTGCQTYLGSEMGRPEPTITLYRPEEEVFSRDALNTFAHRPVTLSHPSAPVTADTWKATAIGMTGSDVLRDKEFISVPLVLMDGDAIEAVRAGTKQLSAGYTTDVEWSAGVAPDGTKYDGVMRSIRANHVAVVDRARAGPACKIGTDAAPPELPLTPGFDRAAAEAALAESRVGDTAAAPPTATIPPSSLNIGGKPVTAEHHTRAVTVDGFKFALSDQAADLVERLQRQVSDAAVAATAFKDEAARVADGLRGQIAAMTASHAEALSAKDGEVAALKATHAEALSAKDGEITAIKAQIPDAAAFDAALASRMACADEAGRVFGDGFDARGKSEPEMRRLAVSKRLGDAVASSMDDAAIGGAFRALVASAPAQAVAQPDPLRVAIAAGGAQAQDSDPRRTAYQEYVHFLENAHRAGKEG